MAWNSTLCTCHSLVVQYVFADPRPNLHAWLLTPSIPQSYPHRKYPCLRLPEEVELSSAAHLAQEKAIFLAGVTRTSLSLSLSPFFVRPSLSLR